MYKIIPIKNQYYHNKIKSYFAIIRPKLLLISLILYVVGICIFIPLSSSWLLWMSACTIVIATLLTSIIIGHQLPNYEKCKIVGSIIFIDVIVVSSFINSTIYQMLCIDKEIGLGWINVSVIAMGIAMFLTMATGDISDD